MATRQVDLLVLLSQFTELALENQKTGRTNLCTRTAATRFQIGRVD